MLKEFKAKISDFFNRLPAVILIPAVLLIAFAIAGVLIWAGIEMSPITQKTAEELMAEKAGVQDGQETGNGSGKTDNSNTNNRVGTEFNSEPGDSRNPGSRLPDGQARSNLEPTQEDESPAGLRGTKNGSSGGTSENDSGGNSSSNIDLDSPDRQIDENSESKSGVNGASSDSIGASGEGANGKEGNQFSESGSQSGSNNNANQNSAQPKCYHPPGDVRKWWHDAPPKQQACYISQHGMPDLGQQVPYFCDYNNSEDCYYR